MLQKSSHISPQHQPFRKNAERTERCGEDESISHLSPVRSEGMEDVVMLHGPEGTLDHCVLKVQRAIIGGDTAGEVLPNAKVGSPPTNKLTQTDQP